MPKPIKPVEINGDKSIAYIETMIWWLEDQGEARSKRTCDRLTALEKNVSETNSRQWAILLRQAVTRHTLGQLCL
jgi:hypothetical protein